MPDGVAYTDAYPIPRALADLHVQQGPCYVAADGYALGCCREEVIEWEVALGILAFAAWATGKLEGGQLHITTLPDGQNTYAWRDASHWGW